MKALLLGLGVLYGGAQAATVEERAHGAALGDTLSTVGAISAGAAEANPLGIAALALKVPILSYIKTLPEDEKADAYALQGSVWSGATANNVCVIVSIASGGALAPFCPLIGVAWGFTEWNKSSEEREFWDICRSERLYWKNPNMTCHFSKKKTP